MTEPSLELSYNAPDTSNIGRKSSVGKPRLKIYADPSESSKLVSELTTALGSDSGFTIISEPLTEPGLRALFLALATPSEKLGLVKEKSIFSAEELAAIEAGDTALLVAKLTGPEGLKYLARPVTFHPLNQKVVLGDNAAAIVELAHSVVSDLSASGKHVIPTSISNTAAAPIRRASLAPAVLPAKPAANYTIYGDKDATTDALYAVLVAGNSVDDVKLATGAIDQTTLRSIAESFPSAGDAIKLFANPSTRLTPAELEKVKIGSLDTVVSKLCGLEGLPHLARPLVYSTRPKFVYVGKIPTELSVLLAGGIARSISTTPASLLATPAVAASKNNAKYIVYHDPANETSVKILNVVSSRVPEDLYKVVSGPLDKAQLKTIQYNLDIAERQQLVKDIKLLSKEQIAKIKKDDVDVLSAFLSGPEGFKNLKLPIVMCPVAGTIVIGDNAQKIEAMLGEDGWNKTLTSRNVVVEIVAKKLTSAPTGTAVGRYKLYHQDFNEKSQMAFEFLRSNLINGQFTIQVQPLEEKEAKDLLDLIKPPVEFLQLVTKAGLNQLSTTEISKVEKGDKAILASKIVGQSGLKVLVRPLLLDTQDKKLLVGPSVDDIKSMLEATGWKAPVLNASMGPAATTAASPSTSFSNNPSSATASVISGALKNSGMKYLIFHDPTNAGSIELYDLFRYSVSSEDYQVVTAALSQNDIKKVMHLLDPKEWITLSKDPKILSKAEQESMIKQNDMNVLAKKLCGEVGLKTLVRPILVCPIAGNIVVGSKIDEVSGLINNGGCLW